MRWVATQGRSGPRGVVMAAAIALFALILALRIIDGNADDPVTLLFVLPIILLASESGLAGGALASLVAIALTAAWAVLDEPGMTLAGFLVRATAFVIVGVLFGLIVDRLRAALRARAALVEQSKDEARHFELARDLMCTATFDGRFDRLNARWTEVLGWSADELRARPFIDFVHPDDRDATVAETAQLAEGGVTVEFVNRYRAKDGRWLWLEWTARGVPERGRIYAAAREITERREGERAIRRLAAIVESSNDAIVTVALDGTITSWNPAATRMSGYSAQEACGMPLSILAPPEAPDELPRLLERVRRGEEVKAFEVRRIGKGDREADLLVSISPLLDADGHVEGASIIARDITQEKRAREELERAKEEFFGSVSHELRTPLTSIIAYTELLEDLELDKLSDQGRKAVEVIGRNARRELRLVGDMLLITRIQEGRFSLQTEPTNLRSVVEEAVEAVRPTAEASKLELHVEAEDIPEFECDPHRIGQAVDNLLSNAIKFTPSGGRIDVRVRRQRNAAAIEVADTGLGIPEAEQTQLFERLYRASSALEHQIQGIGIGLSIVKAIVEAHGGTVRVVSEEGKGTTFTLAIPIAGVAADSRPIAKEEAV